MVWRYYCDFCKKAGCSKGHMVKHERRCTNNPNRVCGMCVLGQIKGQAPLAELIVIAGRPETDHDSLLAAAKGCPACALAAARQSSRGGVFDPEEPLSYLHFDYKRASRDFLDKINTENARADTYYTVDRQRKVESVTTKPTRGKT